MPLLYRFGFRKDGAASVLGDYTDQNVMNTLLPAGTTNYTAGENGYDLGYFANVTGDLLDVDSAYVDNLTNPMLYIQPPILILQAYITDSLLGEQLREVTVIVEPQNLENTTAAAFAGAFMADQVAKNSEVGDLADVNRNLKGASDMMNAGAESDARRRMMHVYDHRRALQTEANNSAIRETMMGALGGTSEGMQHTDKIVTQQTDTLKGATSSPSEVSPNALAGTCSPNV